MLLNKLTAKLTVLTVISLTAAGLTAQPVFSQGTRSLTSETQQTKQTSIQSIEHRAAAVQLYRALELDLSGLRAITAEAATDSASAEFEAETGRSLTESESQQMFNFWARKFGEIFTQENLEGAIASVYMRNFTLEELTAINQSANPIAQIASPVIGQEMEDAVQALGDQFLTDETWMNNMVTEMANELPFLMEEFEQVPGAG